MILLMVDTVLCGAHTHVVCVCVCFCGSFFYTENGEMLLRVDTVLCSILYHVTRAISFNRYWHASGAMHSGVVLIKQTFP